MPNDEFNKKRSRIVDKKFNLKDLILEPQKTRCHGIKDVILR